MSLELRSTISKSPSIQKSSKRSQSLDDPRCCLRIYDLVHRLLPTKSDDRCYTPKFSLLLLKTLHNSILKDFIRVDQTNPLLSNQSKLGFCSSQDKMGFQYFK